MDLFSVVYLSKPKQVTEGVRPLRDGEEPLLESTAGRTMKLILEQPEVESADVLAPTPLRSIPGATVEPSRLDATSVGSAEDADVIGAESETREVDSGLKHKRVEELLEKQEEKLRKLSIEYDEELYPHMLSAIAERRWLISHGLRLAAMSTLESQEVKQSFGDVVKCALARGKAEAVEELHEKKLLTVPAAQVPGYNGNAYEELVAAMETMKLLELPHIAQLERDQDYPIDVIMAGLTLARHAAEGAEAQPDYFLKPDVAQLQVPIFARPCDILNPFALEKEIPLKESLEAHAIRLAKKKGVKGKAILCGVGAAHIPRSDGVPVSVAIVSPKNRELLGKLGCLVFGYLFQAEFNLKLFISYTVEADGPIKDLTLITEYVGSKEEAKSEMCEIQCKW
ncbi:hypothetical protein Tco_0585405 [Tanacetum coccineum]